MLGDWFSLIAQLAMLREVTGASAKELGGFFILKLLPIFLAGPLAGVVADRFSRRAIMIISDVLRTGFVLALLATPLVKFPLAYAYTLVTLSVVTSAFFEPARSALLPRLVDDRSLSSANALGAIMWSFIFAMGSALGGIVTGLVGWRIALVLDAGTYLVSAALLMQIAVPSAPPARKTGATDWQTLTGVRDLREGLRFIARRLDVATVIFIKVGWGIAGPITLFLTLFGERVYPIMGKPDLGVSLLFVGRAIGTGIGPLLARRWVVDETPEALRRLIAVALLFPALWYAAFAFVEHPALATLCVIFAHFGGSVLWVYSSVMLQRMVPDELRGRVISTDIGLATLSISISTWVYGVLADAPGADLRELVLIMALSLLVPTVIWLVASRRYPVGHAHSVSRETAPTEG